MDGGSEDEEDDEAVAAAGWGDAGMAMWSGAILAW
jgi:hypothetical protein